MQTYEQRLDADFQWALLEGSRHFEQNSAVHQALRKITRKLNELGIPYAVVGGMALFYHGYRRFTEDVDILVTKESLHRIHDKLEGRGYVPPFEGSKNLRDTDKGVKIEFIVSGGYPGDGKPKPVAFPDPAEVSVTIGDMAFIDLSTLLELKLASGMTAVGRLKDLADVQEMIIHLKLAKETGDELDPYVSGKYVEMWESVKDRLESSES